ncbi:hypothetical protein N7455_007988 [Penicillium solitum]|uniref:uncharacterized protein n=1 Tax=Penicillium solitum TaxID=60172 RepID=UPI0018284A14|nr:hypothetical protein HAV15_004443 [Penicillium sp. str. \
MMRSYLLAGFLAALSCPTNGLVFKDKIKQTIDGSTLSLLHDVQDATSVQFGTAPDSSSESWEFNTEGFADDEAVITPVDSSKTLICEQGSPCHLDPAGSRIPIRVVRVDEKNPIFTFQDISSSLYLSRTPDLYLELRDVQDESIYFTLEAIHGEYLYLWS